MCCYYHFISVKEIIGDFSLFTISPYYYYYYYYYYYCFHYYYYYSLTCTVLFFKIEIKLLKKKAKNNGNRMIKLLCESRMSTIMSTRTCVYVHLKKIPWGIIFLEIISRDEMKEIKLSIYLNTHYFSWSFSRNS